MNIETQDANTVVESSPSTQAPSNEVDISTLNSEQHHHWRMTGELPAEKGQPQADSATASEADKPAKSAAASEAATPQKPNQKRDNAETRLQEILADLKQAGLSPAELKTFKREAAAAQPRADSKPAPKQPQVTAPALEAPKEPDIADPKYNTGNGDADLKLYEADIRQYTKDLAKYEAAKAVDDFKRSQVEAQQTEKLTSELTAARARYKDFDTIVAPLWQQIATDKAIHPVVQEFVGRSPVMVDVMYAIGGDAETMAKFIAAAKTDPFTALRYAMKAEELVMAELEKGKSGKESDGTQRNDKGQFQASGNKVSKAPAPPSQVDGKGNPPADETEAALSSGDTRGYIDSENKKDLARWKANRR